MKDLRTAERLKTLLKARIVFNQRMTSVDCVVKNISPIGALVTVDTTLAIPNEFELEIPLRGKTYAAQMRWRDAKSIGLRFVEKPAARVAGSPEFQKLQQDNVRLKATLATLTKRLEDLGQDVPSAFF